MSTERKILFRLEANPSAKGKDAALTLQAYDDCGWCQDLYVGDMGRWGSLLFNGTFGGITKDDFVDVNTACVSHFFDKDAKPLVAMITPDKKVYLGLQDDYDSHGHYFQKNYPMIFVSDNDDVFDLIAGSDGPYSIREMKAKEAFGPGELEAFARLGLFIRL